MSRNKKIYFNHPRLPFDEEDISYSDIKVPSHQVASAHGAEKQNEAGLMFISFGSGSSGNSCFIGTESEGIIIDAGIRSDIIEETLERYGISMKRVKGLLLTHDHSDHVRYSYNLLRNNRHLSLYCTPRVLKGLLRRHNISKRIQDYHSPIFKEIPFMAAGMEITAFEVPHDGSDNMGFSIESGKRRFVVATDLGCVADRARFYMSRANYLMIESNYDSDMLRTGRYPEYLKARIRAANGHLDNNDTAAFVAEIANPELYHIFLCHLSKDNNTPDKALSTVRTALSARGFKIGNGEETINDRTCDIQLTALPRYDATRLYIWKN